MNHNDRPNGLSRSAVLPCPVCGRRLAVGLLDIPEEHGETCTLFILDCPVGDYHATFTKDDITKVLAAEVVRRLR